MKENSAGSSEARWPSRFDANVRARTLSPVPSAQSPLPGPRDRACAAAPGSEPGVGPNQLLSPALAFRLPWVGFLRDPPPARALCLPLFCRRRPRFCFTGSCSSPRRSLGVFQLHPAFPQGPCWDGWPEALSRGWTRASQAPGHRCQKSPRAPAAWPRESRTEVKHALHFLS